MRVCLNINGATLCFNNSTHTSHLNDSTMLSHFDKINNLVTLFETIKHVFSGWVLSPQGANVADYTVTFAGTKSIVYANKYGSTVELKPEPLAKLVSFDYKGGHSPSYVIKPEKECSTYLEGRDVMDENQYKKFRKDGITNKKVVLK